MDGSNALKLQLGAKLLTFSQKTSLVIPEDLFEAILTAILLEAHILVDVSLLEGQETPERVADVLHQIIQHLVEINSGRLSLTPDTCPEELLGEQNKRTDKQPSPPLLKRESTMSVPRTITSATMDQQTRDHSQHAQPNHAIQTHGPNNGQMYQQQVPQQVYQNNQHSNQPPSQDSPTLSRPLFANPNSPIVSRRRDTSGAGQPYNRTKQQAKRVAPFSNLLILDGLDRTKPLTQVAIVEAMSVGLLSMSGIHYVMPKPFIVIAVINASPYLVDEFPLEIRRQFLLQVSLEIPLPFPRTKSREYGPAAFSVHDIENLRGQLENLFCDRTLFHYVRDIVFALRNWPRIVRGPAIHASERFQKAVLVNTLLSGYGFVTPSHVVATARSTLSHRIQLSCPEVNLIAEEEDPIPGARDAVELVMDVVRSIRPPL